MPKDSDKPKSDQQKPEPERKFSQEQYDMLKRCSKKKDMTEWNKWRKEHPDEKILLEDVKLQDAYLIDAHLEHARLYNTHLEGASFIVAIVDGSTLIWDCKVDRKTNFLGVGLDNARIHPETKQLLEYNIRRMNWRVWYGKHRFLKWPVRWFWHLSNYGMSTGRIIGWFFGFAFFFAAIYTNWEYWFHPGVVNDLFIESEMPEHISLTSCFLVYFFRPIYFSVVTMTTLGFGDMYAKAWSWPGHVLLMVQVILGYVLLAALVTRFAVLFTAGGEELKGKRWKSS